MRELNKIIEKFAEKQILVIGDVMLDEYIFGDVTRINPEAPVPILNANKKEYRLGGAANVANNITSLGGNCTLIGQVGKDKTKENLIKELNNKKIHYFLIENDDFKTIKKTRIIARNQQVIRVDWENSEQINEEKVNKIIQHVKENSYDLILISDYNKGMIRKSLMEKLKPLGIKIIVDPRPKNISFYNDVFMLSPNLKEAKEISKKDNIEEIGKFICEEYKTNVIITCGENGAYSFNKKTGKCNYFPTKAKEVYDVSGAGDTFISVVSLAISSGSSLYESIILGNQAAGIVVRKMGTSAITSQELKKSFDIQKNKIKDIFEIKEIIENSKENGRKIVFTNGCFDILHIGHIKLIKKAKSFGDILILGLNTDESIRNIKGQNKPINNQEERAEILSALEYVDYILFFGENNPCELIKEIKPDIHVKGGDYDPNDYNNMPEAKIVKDYGGKIEIIDLADGKSTSDIIEKIKKFS